MCVCDVVGGGGGGIGGGGGGGGGVQWFMCIMEIVVVYVHVCLHVVGGVHVCEVCMGSQFEFEDFTPYRHLRPSSRRETYMQS